MRSSADKRLERFERRALLQAVECLGVAVQNLVGLGVADPTLIRPAAGFVERAQIGGGTRKGTGYFRQGFPCVEKTFRGVGPRYVSAISAFFSHGTVFSDASASFSLANSPPRKVHSVRAVQISRGPARLCGARP